MGLDMYLFRQKKNNEDTKEEIGYWRKANQIREFFVRECGYGINSDCEEFFVTRDQLEKLKYICGTLYKEYEKNGITNKLISSCDKYLPTSAGFFFGSTDYDEWYFNDLKETIDIMIEAIDGTDWDTEEVYYYEWW